MLNFLVNPERSRNDLKHVRCTLHQMPCHDQLVSHYPSITPPLLSLRSHLLATRESPVKVTDMHKERRSQDLHRDDMPAIRRDLDNTTWKLTSA